MRILVTGGAGYIGSHTAKALSAAGFEPVVYDNLSTGHRWAVNWGPLIESDLADREALKRAIRSHSITAVVHFAAHAYVGESMLHPKMYFQNNIINTLCLLDTLLDEGVSTIVFSSSCAVYGTPDEVPIREEHPTVPVNPYGESKLFVERALKWYEKAYNLRWAALRYFNASGADPNGELGEAHDPETHLIPLVIQAAMRERGSVEIYGLDYPTVDGTAIRDYIHVSDLAEAHVIALQHLLSRRSSFTVNLGTGIGISVREVIAAVERAVGARVETRPADRRLGDPPALVANPSRAEHLLGWRPRLSTIDEIIATAWRWNRAGNGSMVKRAKSGSR